MAQAETISVSACEDCQNLYIVHCRDSNSFTVEVYNTVVRRLPLGGAVGLAVAWSFASLTYSSSIALKQLFLKPFQAKHTTAILCSGINLQSNI